MDEVNVAKIVEALAKDTIPKACRAVGKVLIELGYYLAVPKQ